MVSLALLGIGLVQGPATSKGNARNGDWASYHGNAGGDHFSPLTQINPRNVESLEPAWRIDTGPGGLQTTPLVIDGILYGLTPDQKIFAVDATNGKQLWQRTLPDSNKQPVRGLNYWTSGKEHRILVGAGAYLHALEPETGQSILSFGDKGRVDLRENLGRPSETVALSLTTPASIWKDLAIVGFRTAESSPAAPGAIRAYDIRTGKLRWIFNVIPRPGQPGYETWPAEAWKTAGGANNWQGMVVDEARGIVFAPTGSAVDDFYGGGRKGNNLYANSLVALDAATGRVLWHYQMVHHDILDRDPPSPPVLLTVKRNGKSVDAVAQATKHGVLFLFDRVTGKPLFPIDEMAVPASTVPGEQSSPTQPMPRLPAPYSRQRLTADMLTKRTPAAHSEAAKAFSEFVSDGPFSPMRLDKRTIVFPGFDGGAEWGGQAIARGRGILYINANDVAWTGALAHASQSGGAAIYQQNCAACHGIDRKGSPPEFPSLEGILARQLEGEVLGTILRGKGRMPAFSNLSQSTPALMEYLRNGDQTQPAQRSSDVERASKGSGNGSGQRYIFTGYRKFVDADGYPAVAPPWGTLSAIDMNSGRYLWRVPFGEYPALKAAGMAPTGSENYGGPVVTASGLLFIGATIFDHQLRAFDAASGKVLWQTTLPQSGVAMPITYMAKGRQYVVIATSNARDQKSPAGSGYSAFALPLVKH
ncbi:PQQ-binding-like beta-propeller repeat protein [Sphingobium sp. H39-3-25]|uniref:outer membrane protein assembly factor BamB family protein n=1 Tax=Sphingobium arseniciresistens TaxID=3030834 RepID=UPI0023BA365E|nr:PQQ-binding-like beta-propeller repeat protein [Sphingobium arseniciresistens]